MGSFEDALRRPGLVAIAEVKRRSPSAGDLRLDADPAKIAAAYERAGAAAVSILVDERFGGSWDDLRAARAAASLPLVAKGFFSTEEDLRAAREAGADAALLLLRDLDDDAVRRLFGAAADLGLETLVEAHDSEELARAVALDAPVIGVNARDLATFEIDRAEQLRLVARAPRDRVVIAESGIESRAQGAAAELAGADAILVGSTLMRAPDPAAKLAELLSRPLVKVCGLTCEEDVAAAAEAGADMVGFVLARASPRRAARVLPVSDTLLTVAVVVGTAETDGADLVQLYPEEEGKVRGRDAVLLREGEQVATVVDLPWQEDDPTHLDRARDVEGRVMLAGGLGPENVRRGDRDGPAVGRRCELEPRDLAWRQGSRAHSRLRGGGAMTIETYGAYGGRYVPETLIPALDELERGWVDASADPAFREELDRLGERYVGRPSPLYETDRFAPAGQADRPQARGPEPHRGAQDQQRARADPPRLAPRQAAYRRGDRRGTARRRDGHRLCALRARVRRLHGLRGHASPAPERRAHAPPRRGGAPGRVRNEDAEGGDERGYSRLDRERRDDVLPHRLVRRAGAVPEHRARVASGDRTRGTRRRCSRRTSGSPTLSSPASGEDRTQSGCSRAFSTMRRCGS